MEMVFHAAISKRGEPTIDARNTILVNSQHKITSLDFAFLLVTFLYITTSDFFLEGVSVV